jgi:ABC-type uncharacterized transport system auxiliary subunit
VKARTLLLLTVIAACGPPPQRHYYTLTAQPPGTRFEKPVAPTLRVRDLEVRRSYRREELVVRTDAHELTYAHARRWSEPLPRMIGDLVREQVRGAGLALEVQDESATTAPDFVLGGDVEAVEQLDVGRDRYAHLEITFRLMRGKDDFEVWSFHADGRRPVSGASARSTVQVLSDILADETDQALADLAKYFADPTRPRPPPAPPPAAAPGPAPDHGPAEAEAHVIGPEDNTMRDVPQLQHDDTPVPVGFGAVFAPTLSDGEREPRLIVYQNGHEVADGQHGRRVVLPPGEYDVHVGSGAVDQQLGIPVRVVEGKTTVIPPSWAALEVSVVNDTFIPFRGTYELINMGNRDALGLGFGADETLGEITRVWVLPPGLYKLIRAGGTYRDRTNFATVRVEAGKLTRFTLVLDQNDGSFHGAGENDPVVGQVVAYTDEEEAKQWQLRAVLGGNLAFNRTDQVGQPVGWKLSFAIFFDGQARYADGPHVWLTRLELEEGQTRVFSQDSFQSDTDRVYLNSVYTYQVLPWFGPYARVGAESKLLPRSQLFDSPRDVKVLDASGNTAQTLMAASSVELGSTFAPTQLKQGAGGNFRVFRKSFLELDLRVGFGARQTIAAGLKVFETQPDGTYDLRPVEDSNLFGLEATFVALGRISSFMTVSSELDGLAPVASGNGVVFTWRNQATLRLVSFLSLNYRFNATRDPSLGQTDVTTEHDVQLRASWVIF